MFPASQGVTLSDQDEAAGSWREKEFFGANPAASTTFFRHSGRVGS
jgi:hypothetical protein